MNYKDNAFPLTKQGVNLTSQTGLPVGAYLCAEDGALLIKYVGGNETINCLAGDAYNIIPDDTTANVTVDIVSGTFHRA